MNKIWADRLIAGTKKWAEVPASRKEAVKAILQAKVESGDLREDQFKMIISEKVENEE